MRNETFIIAAAAAALLAGCSAGEPSDYAAAGEKALAEGNWAAAADSLTVAVKEDPGNADTLVQLAEAQLMRGEKESADAAVKSALKLRPDDPYAILVDGKTACALQEWKRALAAFEKLAYGMPEATPQDRASALNGIAVVAKLAKMPSDESTAALLHALYLDPKNAAAYYHLAEATAESHPAIARDFYNMFVRMPGADKRHVDNVKNTKLPEIESRLKSRPAGNTSVNEKRSNEYLTAAKKYKARKLIGKAEWSYRAALKENPGNTRAVLELIDMLRSDAKQKSSLDAKKKVMSAYKDAFEKWRLPDRQLRNMCTDVAEFGRIAKLNQTAARIIERFLLTHPGDAKAARLLAGALERNGKQYNGAAARYIRFAADAEKPRASR